MSWNARDLQHMLNDVHAYGQDFRLKFSEEKIEVIVVNGAQDEVDRIW